MKKSRFLIVLLFAFIICAPSVYAQVGAKGGQDPSTIRDPDLEKDSLHSLEVARLYFRLRKAYVAALQRCEEIIAGNPHFASIDEVLFIAGESSRALAENKGKQLSSLYVTFDGNNKRTLKPEEFRKLGREYLSRLLNEHPQSKFRRQAEEGLRALVGPPKPKTEGRSSKRLILNRSGSEARFPFWSAPAERSGDGALDARLSQSRSKAVSRFACHRTPNI